MITGRDMVMSAGRTLVLVGRVVVEMRNKQLK